MDQQQLGSLSSRRTVVELVGAFRLRRGGDPLALSGTGQRVIAFLALRGETPRATVAGTLWPEVADPRAQACLRTALWRLHRRAPDLVVAHVGRLSLAGDVAVDIRELPSSGTGSGELLPEWDDEWLLLERERIRQARLYELERQGAEHVAAGQLADAIATAYRVIIEEPLRESGYRLLVGAHLAEGNLVEAVRQFETFRASSRAELGVEPSPAFARLLRAAVGRVPAARDSQAGGPQKVASR